MTDAPQPLRVLHITDPHLHARDGERLRGVDTNASFRRTLAAVLAERPDLLLATGDLVQDDSQAGYERFRDALAGCGVPVLVVPGNHDVPDFLRATLGQAPFQLGGHRDIGGWRLVMLDSYAAGDAAGELPEAELARLATALADAPGPALVALHHHPVAMGSRWLDRVGLRNAGALFDCIERHPQVRVLLWGHVHQAWDSVQGSLRLLATPSTCAQFRPLSDSFALDDRPPAYRRLLLHPDGRVTTEVVWLD